MAALNQPGRHLTLLNATDMVAGQVFTFDRQTLDDVCMDYDKVPVSLAVNASADVPFAFTPVLLHNDSYLLPNCPGQRNPGLPYLTTLQSPGGPYANLEAYRTARYRQSLRNEVVVEQGTGDKVPPYRMPVYLRLVDGGVADNSGLTALRRAMSTLAPADIGRLAAQGKLRRIVVVAVNAGVDPPNDLDHSTRYTTLLDMADGITNTLLNSASANSAAVFQDFIKLLINDRDSLVLQDGQTQANFAVYPISIDFDQLPNATEAERQQLQKVKSIATSWTLKSGDVALLDQVAGELLWRHPCFRLLVSDIRLQGKPEAGPIPGLRCPVEPPVPISQRGKPRPA
jgi:NTE family protein